MLGRLLLAAAACIVLATAVACNPAPSVTPTQPSPQEKPEQTTTAAGFSLTSEHFKPGETIPPRFTCDGANISPELAWSNAPPGTVTFALIADDPDAPSGVYTHWVIFDVPAAVHSLLSGVPRAEQLDNGAIQGRNDAGSIGYTGPCPPSGTHHYRFTVYALNAKLELQPGATKQQVLEAMKGHILGQAQLVGTYQRVLR